MACTTVNTQRHTHTHTQDKRLLPLLTNNTICQHTISYKRHCEKSVSHQETNVNRVKRLSSNRMLVSDLHNFLLDLLC